ncbi:methyltransferase [Pokkaliibacter sp. CJK22405]|uniref:methyltransferase n=1 Tax=Pokkaliibacter sp. CJK22405 TaxID=3384615 RepID=UPI0039850E82
MINTFSPFLDEVKLSRYPKDDGSDWQAFDAADAYLLDSFQRCLEGLSASALSELRVLILNDQFGALSLAITSRLGIVPVSRTDSWLALKGARDNGEILSLPVDTDSILSPLEGHFDVVLWRVPKSLAYMEDQLQRIAPHISAKTRVFAGGMVKHLANGHFKTLAKLGEVGLGLAVKKARVVEVTPEEERRRHLPAAQRSEWLSDDVNLTFTEYANVFSKGHLDIGSRFLLQQFDKIAVSEHDALADLGCGNGLLGIYFAKAYADISLTGVDESFMAVASAQSAAQVNLGAGATRCEWMVNDGLDGEQFAGRFNLILNNPPFHQQQGVGDHIATRMFLQSFAALKLDGRLVVVGNRHLGYHRHLHSLFGNCRTLAADPKFVVLESVKTRSEPGRLSGSLVKHHERKAGQQQRQRQNRRKARNN